MSHKQKKIQKILDKKDEAKNIANYKKIEKRIELEKINKEIPIKITEKKEKIVKPKGSSQFKKYNDVKIADDLYDIYKVNDKKNETENATDDFI